jgi:photosystem II stability/assembly factor-like uncharacterized protein
MTNRIALVRQFAVRLATLATVLIPIVCSPSGAVAAWRATGPYGGDAEVIRTVPKVRNLVIAGARNGLLFTSSDGGATWKNIRFPAQFGAVLHALEVDPRSAATWYVGTESENSWLSGVYKTEDAGQTWTLLPATKGLAVWSIALWPKNPDVIAVGASTGVHLSRDAGSHWAHISPEGDPEIRPVVSLAFDPVDANVIFAGTTHLPWKTADGGKNWNSIHQGMIDDSDVFSIQVDPAKPERVFASACSGVYGSTDGAARWSHLETPKGAFRTHFVALDPANSEIVFAGTTEGLLRSTDGGRSWRNVIAESVKSVAFDSWVPGRVFFASTTAGLLVSTDSGATLREINIGFANRNFTTFAGTGFDLYAASVYEAASGGLYRSNNYGLRWTHFGAPAGEQFLLISAAPNDAKILYAATYHSLYESLDNGKTWRAKKGPSGGRITALMAISDKIVLAATDQGLFRTPDGVTWIQCAVGQVVLLQGLGKKMYSAVTSHGALSSADGGISWKQCGQPASGVAWYGLDFDAVSTRAALAATSAGLFRSSDGCSSWTVVSNGLRAETVTSLLFHPTHSGEAFVSQNGRVLVSTDGGQKWLPLDDDAQGNSGPSSLAVLPAAPDLLFALFPRRGVFSTSIKEKPLQ